MTVLQYCLRLLYNVIPVFITCQACAVRYCVVPLLRHGRACPGHPRPSGDRPVQVIPLRILSEYQPYFPFTRPVLDVVFALNGRLNIFVMFEVDEPLDCVSFRKSRDQAIAMLVDSSHEVVRNTHVQDAVGCARQYVKIATCHAHKMKDVDGRDKPGHDEETSSATTPGEANRASQ